jgi:N-hydroxyarylamine O-acetyltransferase
MTIESKAADAFLTRLQLDRRPPSADALRELQWAHLAQVPYETLWIHSGDIWSIDPHAAMERIINGRGGYCFHLNGALALLLEHLGYRVTHHVGGVHGPEGPTQHAMTNHLVLLVHDLPTDDNPTGTWYVDTGLGDGPLDPIALREHTSQHSPLQFGLSRCETDVADWQLHHDPRGSFIGMAFNERVAALEEFAERHIQLATAADSSFARTVTVQRRTEGRIAIVRGQVLTVITEHEPNEVTTFDHDGWFDLMRDEFNLRLDHADMRDRLWDRVSATHQRWLARSNQAASSS